jgi:trimeric autotransporter adhesin
MKPKFTCSMSLEAVTNKKVANKNQFLFAFILAIFSCCVTTGYAQTTNTKPGKLSSAHNLNDLHLDWPWLTKGNSGTNPSKNFIGTRDARPLVFKVNGQKAGYLGYDSVSRNTTFGYQDLNSNVVTDISGITGSNNSAFGYSALYSNISGEVNTALGSMALHSNTEGNVNTSIGGFSLFLNTTGAFNTATGSFALFANTEGGFNTATGDYALAGNTTGSFNIANGTPFTLVNSEGSENIATGALSMTNNSTGNDNVGYGVFSLASNTTGSNNMALGSYADVTAGDLNNATVIGAGALVDASNKVRIGNADVTSIGGEVGWTSYSDERIKDNIQENVPGLEFIKALRPVTYHFNVSKQNTLLGIRGIGSNKIMSVLKNIELPGLKGMQVPSVDISRMKINDNANEKNHEIEKVQFTGFLAQDVERAANNIGYDFSGIDKSGTIMGLRYGDFVVPLVKAVQELSKQNEDLQKQINELKAMINSNAKTDIMLSGNSLEQNNPNPFDKATIISYTLPQKFSNAQIVITDESGKTLRRVTVSGAGQGTLRLDGTNLSSGVYNYSLIVDNKLISSKQMILGK